MMTKDTAPLLGILMLDTQFPRIVGDVGNAATWPFDVQYSIVKGATPQAIVCDDPTPFVQAFIAEGRALVAQGCTWIATTCGFLAPLRTQLAEALGVPVAASALEQTRQIKAMLPPDQHVGVLTISASSLTGRHLKAADVSQDTVIMGMEGTTFAASILNNVKTLDVELAREEMVQAAKKLIQTHPTTGAILLECTNMPPYAADIARETGRPVFSIVTYLNWFHASQRPSIF